PAPDVSPLSLHDALPIFVGRDNTVVFGKLRLQLPPSPIRHHYVKAKVKVRRYDDGSIAVFHGPRRIASFNPDGSQNQPAIRTAADRKSTRLNSSHVKISY